MPKDNRPNILLIVTDQHRADHSGFGGNKIVRTPNLDALAARGRVFDQAFVANPICMPNRCSMLTGRVPTAHEVIFNDRSLAWTSNTFVRQLADNGYNTGLVGKAHIQHGSSREAVIALDKTPAVNDPYPEGWNTLEDFEQYLDSAGPVSDFYGFQHAEFTLGHGDIIAGHHYRWAIEKGANKDDLLLDWPAGSDWPAIERSEHWWQVYQPTCGEAFYSTTFVTERSCDWIANQQEDTPWFLQCSFPDPHHPFTPPGKWWDAYQAEDMPLPNSFNDTLEHAPEHLKFFKNLKPSQNVVQMFGATENIVKDSMAAEFGMIEYIDECIGKVLAEVAKAGMLDNTIVMFTSDHGDMFGDHGLMLKGMMHYEGAIRVPLVVSGPGIKPGRTQSLASSLDIAQTVLALTEIQEFDRMQGVSLTPILEDAEASVRDHVYIEEDMPPMERSGFLPFKARTLVTTEARITSYSTGEVEVYDRKSDAEEMNNLGVTKPSAELVSTMKQQLLDKLIQYSDSSRMNVE